MRRIALVIVLIALAIPLLGAGDCQPCEDPSQLFCP